MWSSNINPAHDEIGPNMSLVAEQHLLDQPVGSDDPDLSTSVESVELQLAGDGGSGLVTVGCSTSTSAVNIGGPNERNMQLEDRNGLILLHVVKLLTVLISHNIPTSGPDEIIVT